MNELYEITKMLTLSCAHVTEDTYERLFMDGIRNEIGLPVYEKTPPNDGESYGLFVYIDQEPNEKAIPEDLRNVIRLALENGCGVICLDSDGPEIDELPLFDWND